MDNAYQYVSQNMMIGVGGTVDCTDVSVQRSTTSNAEEAEWWDSGVPNPGESYSFIFIVPYMYAYWSTFPMEVDMVGAVALEQPAP